MPRRNFQTAKKGQVYAVEWPEWHVDCAEPNCEAHALAEAEETSKKSRDCEGWVKRKGLWYCPQHAK